MTVKKCGKSKKRQNKIVAISLNNPTGQVLAYYWQRVKGA